MPRPRRPALLSLLGDSGAGKTTLAAALVARWKAAGLRVGYVKHASHGFTMDRPGKDSARAAQAGADGVVVTGPGGTAFLEPTEGADDPRRLVERFLSGRDVVVLEGFRDAALPSVAIAARGETAAAAARRVLGRLLAVVGSAAADRDDADVPPLRGAPVFPADEVGALAAHLEAVLGLPTHPAQRAAAAAALSGSSHA